MKELDGVVRGEERTRSPHCAVFSPLFHVTERRKNEELKPQRLVSTSPGIDMSFFPEQLSKILHARTSTGGVFIEGTVCDGNLPSWKRFSRSMSRCVVGKVRSQGLDMF